MIRFAFLFLAFSLFLSTPSFAMNQWYQQGFNDGISYQDQICRATIDQSVSLVQQENAKLRQEIARLQAAAQVQPAQPVQNQAYLSGGSIQQAQGIPEQASKARYYDNVDD